MRHYAGRSPDDFEVIATSWGSVALCCPACGDWIEPERDECENPTLRQTREAAVRHLGEKHPAVIDGEIRLSAGGPLVNARTIDAY